MISASESPTGHIAHTDLDIAKLGPFPLPATSPIPASTATASATKLLHLYNATGAVHWQPDPNVPYARWRKLLYNSTFNPVAAVLALGTTSLRTSETAIADLILPLMAEIRAIAKAAAGVELEAGAEMAVVRTDPVDGDFMPSMGQDAAKGNFMEVETIVGEPLREAERCGVQAPTLKVVYGLLRAIQWRTKLAKGMVRVGEFGPGNPYGAAPKGKF